ncbi:hypothetical protein BCR39DRAFT_498733 [Naematelia encephala]|uniref:WHIM1 domain-containing protein n=1 Tax=Naematelia encephala TaxID=71784 RepID=A0A1Y2ATP0_9TREE|nr:hypothetical protein BCR39DRAFT_498733 [Naematelia encephala]
MSTSSLSPIKPDVKELSDAPHDSETIQDSKPNPIELAAPNGKHVGLEDTAIQPETSTKRIKVKPLGIPSSPIDMTKPVVSAVQNASVPSDDWQTAYVWAFISKFHQRSKIPKLECYDDYERSLVEPVPNRPDDTLEGILICFLNNLKPGIRNLDCENVQAKLSEYISDMLAQSTEFTVWDHEWAHNEEARGSCCTSNPDRLYLGRLLHGGETVEDRVEKNPIRRMQKENKGLFELDWQERVKLLRQLVDWQLTACPAIRSVIDNEWKFAPKLKKDPVSIDYSVHTEPLGQDRLKNRIWALDDSGRLYRSGNPFKRPCHLVLMSRNLAELRTYTEQCQAHGASKPPRAKGSGSKGRMTAAEEREYKKTIARIKSEKELGEKLEELIPAVEKEEARVLRQKRKSAERARFAQTVEERSTRTRRPTKQVDYTYDDGDDFVSIFSFQTRTGETSYEEQQSRRPVIPGERQSARVRGLDTVDHSDAGSTGTHSNGAGGGGASIDVNGASGEGGRKKRMKGYAWVEEVVPWERLSEEEKLRLRAPGGENGVPNGDEVPAAKFEQGSDETRMGTSEAEEVEPIEVDDPADTAGTSEGQSIEVDE